MKKNPTTNRTSKIANIWFQKALEDVEAINKLTTREAGLTANAVIKNQHIEDKVRDEIQDKLGDAFDNIAMAATAKIDTI